MGFASYLSLVQVLALFPLGVALHVAVFDAEGWSVLRAERVTPHDLAASNRRAFFVQEWIT